jgi:hypothetical protein
MTSRNPSDSYSGIIPAILATVVFSILAGVLSAKVGLEYGTTLFVFVPLLAGCIAGLCTNTFRAASLALVPSIGICLISLQYLGIEGLFCIAMALPLICALALLGAALAQIVKRAGRIGRGPRGTVGTVLVGLFLVGCSGIVERVFVEPSSTQSVVTSRVFTADADQVWEALLEFQRVTGRKPLLLQLGLPVPLRCTMEGKGIGAKRVCYFDDGTIEERVSIWEPPSQLGVVITKVTLPGRDWLQFVDATYELEELGSGRTLVHRTTSYSSVLRPRGYWRLLEYVGTKAEHEYLFNALESKLGGG